MPDCSGTCDVLTKPWDLSHNKVILVRSFGFPGLKHCLSNFRTYLHTLYALGIAM